MSIYIFVAEIKIDAESVSDADEKLDIYIESKLKETKLLEVFELYDINED